MTKLAKSVGIAVLVILWNLWLINFTTNYGFLGMFVVLIITFTACVLVPWTEVWQWLKRK